MPLPLWSSSGSQDAREAQRSPPFSKPLFSSDEVGCFYKIVWVLSPHSFTKCPHGFHQLERKMTSWPWHELKNTHTVENGTSALFRLGCLSFVSSSCLLTLSSAVFVTSEITTRKLGHPCVHTIARTCPSSPQKDRASQVLFHAL